MKNTVTLVRSETDQKRTWRKPRMRYERDEFNSYQNLLYKRALFGLVLYSPEELKLMHWDKRRRIEKVNKHAQSILNIWKQQITNKITNELLCKFFGNSKFVKEMVDKYGNYSDPGFISTVDFKGLGITKKEIVNKLITEGILPHDFYDLKPLPKNGKTKQSGEQKGTKDNRLL